MWSPEVYQLYCTRHGMYSLAVEDGRFSMAVKLRAITNLHLAVGLIGVNLTTGVP